MDDRPVAGVAHQAGTARFGNDPADSVLDRDCRAHEVDNLYVVDTSFFPSIGAVNPALTAMANALRGAMRELDAELPVAHVMTMREIVAESVRSRRFQALLAGVFAGASLLLACLGGGVLGLVAIASQFRRRKAA